MNLFVVFSGLQLEGQLPHQMDMDQWPKMKEQLAKAFASRTQAEICIGQHTKEILLEVGYSQAEIQELLKEGVVDCPNMKSSL